MFAVSSQSDCGGDAGLALSLFKTLAVLDRFLALVSLQRVRPQSVFAKPLATENGRPQG